jgi:hypothetical protein
VQAAVADLIKRKPHLAAPLPHGDVGQGARSQTPEAGRAAKCAEAPEQAQYPRDRGGPPVWATRPSAPYESEDTPMNTRTMAAIALAIAVLLLFFLVILPRI